MKNLLLITAITGLTALTFSGCAHTDTASRNSSLAPVADGPDSSRAPNRPQNNFDLNRSSMSY